MEGQCVKALRVRFPMLFLAVAVVAVAIAVGLMFPCRAFAVVNLGNVSVSMSGSVAVQSGGSTAVSAVCTPAYSDQLPCCMNSYCPSGCDFGVTDGNTACLDPGSGQCTCYGYSYSRYYTSCTVGSSDPSVATASWSNSTLYISGYRPGTATVTVYPSLRLFTSVPASITVTVNAASSGAASDSESSSANAGDSGSDSGSAGVGSSTGASTGSGTVSGSGSGSVSVTPSATPQAASVVQVISAAADGDVVAGDETAAVENTYHIGDEDLVVGDLLRSVAGTDTVLSLWGGDDPEAPRFIWEIPGSKLSADDDLDIDLMVEDVRKSDETLAQILNDVTYSALRVAQEGTLPGTMQLFWRTADVIPNDVVVDVYTFDEKSGKLVKVYSNLTTAEGYLCFNAAQGGVYVISEDSDLEAAGIAVYAVDSEGERTAEDDDAEVSEQKSADPPWVLVAVGIGVVVVVAIAGGTVLRRKRKASVVAADGSDDFGVTNGSNEEG